MLLPLQQVDGALWKHLGKSIIWTFSKMLLRDGLSISETENRLI